MPESKTCAQCGTEFQRPPGRSAKQWAIMRCCSPSCANTIRAREAANAGANFKGGPEHGWKVRQAWLRSPKAKKAVRDRQRVERRRIKRQAIANRRRQLVLWQQTCGCGVVLLGHQRTCLDCALKRKRKQRQDWHHQNPDYNRIYQRARKVLQNTAQGKCSPQAAKARYDFYGGHCAYCRQPLAPLEQKPRTWHWDHVIPLSRGGSNWPANLRPSCAVCNRAKGARSLAAA